jgi:thymidylate kinase
MESGFPSLIFITGTDGAGKSCLAQWLVHVLQGRGFRAGLVWSRFNNFLTKPLLGLTRLTGHNYYKRIDGVLFGFHNFEHLNGFRHLFALLQAIDVNIAALRYITKAKRSFDIVICERGPWDTLVDVIADTELDKLHDSVLGRLFTTQARTGATVLFIKRSKDNILRSRPELVHDYKLDRRIAIYNRLAEAHGWFVIDNNKSLATTQAHIARLIGIRTGIK